MLAEVGCFCFPLGEILLVLPSAVLFEDKQRYFFTLKDISQILSSVL